jgi:KaiC/GvpD/RAD55 family RecA-like ATPase
MNSSHSGKGKLVISFVYQQVEEGKVDLTVETRI